ncbi:MAG: hypothetical protein WCW47_00480 [Candidatus Paceibacterota bacterium]|jgi:hypothetical protein
MNTKRIYFIVLGVFLFVTIFIFTSLYASTTISTNINTGGSLTVSSTGIFAGNVGIGTTTPATSLSIVATPSTTSYVDGIASTYYPTNLLSITDTAVSAVNNTGILIDYIVNPSSNPGSKTYRGQVITLSTPSSNEQSVASASLRGIQSNVKHQGSGNLSSLIGITLNADFTGSGTIANQYGTSGSITVTGSGNVTNLYGNAFSETVTGSGNISNLKGESITITHTGNGNVTTLSGTLTIITHTGSGTITSFDGSRLTLVNTVGTINTAYGFRFESLTGAGTVGNTYAFYVGDITAGTQTNTPYSFYASDAGAYNYFAGNTGIGTTTPQTKLHVSSGASATTTVTVGELGLTTSKACVNMNQADGSAGSFYLAGGTVKVEDNYCR